MARYTGPKNRLARAVGRDLGLKSNVVKLQRRLGIPPGQHGPKGSHGKPSDYRIQLKEKQKVRWTYGILEKQLHKYYTEAHKNIGATGIRMLQLLELRLDNVVYRLGFAPTRAAARQFVSHGHILVDGKVLNIPSYQVKVNQTVGVDSKLTDNPILKLALNDKRLSLPKWLERQALVGKIAREPERNDIENEITEQLIVEYYSR